MGLLVTNARVLTLGMGHNPPYPRRGKAMSRLEIIPSGEVFIESGRITHVGEAGSYQGDVEDGIDADGRVLMPAFVDPHTHACFAGDRLDEWEKKLAGATYLEILEAGGGIMSTVRATREAMQQQLVLLLKRRLDAMMREGTTTVEVKSGYGLTTQSEIKMLRSIEEAAKSWPGTVVPTACIGHAMDPAQDDFDERTIHETLQSVHASFPYVAIDAYCEQSAWSFEDCARLFEEAIRLGHPFRVHTDQFNELGMTRWAIEHGALSVDHLEATSPEELERVAKSATMGVILPASGFHTDQRYADGRAFIDAGGALALATNFNPGSAPTLSMPMAIALATRFCGLTIPEAIVASTVNGAALLGLHDRGMIAEGKRADLILLRHRDERQLAYQFGGNPVEVVICEGDIIHGA